MMKKERIDIRPDSVFKNGMAIYVSHARMAACHLHRHEFYEIDLIVSGKGTSIIESTPKNIECATCFLNFPYTTHAFEANENDCYEIYNIAFSDRFVSRECMNYIYRLESAPCISLNKKELEILKNDAQLIISEYSSSSSSMNQELIRTRLEAMIMYILSKTPKSVNKGDLSPIQSALAYISRNLDKKITAAELAEVVHVSPSYFGTYFKTHYGVGHKAYITELRMKNAMSLLLSTDNSLTAISDECGFASVSNFVKAFKDYWGEHPIEVRKKHNK